MIPDSEPQGGARRRFGAPTRTALIYQSFGRNAITVARALFCESFRLESIS